MTNNMSAINFSVELAALWQAYQKCLRHKRAKRSAATFSAALADNLLTLQERLVGNSWQPSPSTAFVIKDPKPREIHAATFSDRIVHHWLVPRLESLFEPIFIHDVYSNRKGKGTHKAAQRLAHFMRGLAQPAYYLQLDIHNFFKEGLNRSVFLRRSRHGGIFRGRRCGFCLLSLTLSYFFVALMPFLRPFLHNRRNTAY